MTEFPKKKKNPKSLGSTLSSLWNILDFGSSLGYYNVKFRSILICIRLILQKLYHRISILSKDSV